MLRIVWSSGGIDSRMVYAILKTRYNIIECWNFENQLASFVNLFYQNYQITLRIVLFQDRLINLIYKRNIRDKIIERIPCLLCNTDIKTPLGYLIQNITNCKSYSGHYIRKITWLNNILNSLFLNKSQQYFKILLSYKIWYFPLGFIKKDNIKLIARYLKIDIKESMNLCYFKQTFKTIRTNRFGCIVQNNKLDQNWTSHLSIKYITDVSNIKYINSIPISMKSTSSLYRISKWGITWNQNKLTEMRQIGNLYECSNYNTIIERRENIVSNNVKYCARLITSNR
ncbi:tRNA-specific 2-thiouridylase [Candidatus Hodgkinia cicadicola]|uniref:tRNA-specific 2-thiouridylase n=1 Tax=Candidatus Hodgkinia cicadicola TaxID=573658 RepID=A0ABX4MGR1_9HYPH|nr:tRNA-specific 2-thiouridylase [Candidatus Hodgkinia cicadicola]